MAAQAPTNWGPLLNGHARAQSTKLVFSTMISGSSGGDIKPASWDIRWLNNSIELQINGYADSHSQERGPEVLQFDEVANRPLQPGEIRLKVEAIGLNRAEIMYREGQYLEQAEFPSPIGYEAAGVIKEVGPEVVGLKPGDRAASSGVLHGPLWKLRRLGCSSSDRHGQNAR